jgi:hypothetical protein
VTPPVKNFFREIFHMAGSVFPPGLHPHHHERARSGGDAANASPTRAMKILFFWLSARHGFGPKLMKTLILSRWTDKWIDRI